MRIIFAGTPDFAVPCLQSLLHGPHEVIAVYSQPDRPAGRGRKLTASPVKQCALEHNIPVYQPIKLKDETTQTELAALKPDLMVVVAYGLILPAAVLAIPTHGCINVHASLLPRWRGAAPIQRAILAGDSETGVTIMQMDAGLDTGPMLLEKSCAITAQDTGGSLHDRLAKLGAEALDEAIDIIAKGEQRPRLQPAAGISYAEKLNKAEARINWQHSAEQIARQICAFNPWPVAETQLDNQRIRIWLAQAEPGSGAPAGRILSADADALRVATGDGVLAINQLQWPGGKPMHAGEARHGRNLDGQSFS
ncbi:MAG: methionyl-tRNA formyltransferase [Nevskiales bacterium]